MNVLLVDLVPETQARWREWIERAGHRLVDMDTESAASAAEGVTRPDVVISDDQEPSPGGLAILHQVRSGALGEGVYLILVAQDDGPRIGEAGLRQGVDDLLVHPVSEGDIAARLLVAAQTLANRRTEALLWKRAARIPSDCPYPILEVGAEGDLLHANPAALPVLESWSWKLGAPIPAPLQRLVLTVLAEGVVEPETLVCGASAYSFQAVVTDEGGVTLYGHELLGEHPPTAPQDPPIGAASLGLFRRDRLTGLPHRSVFAESLREAVRAARQEGNSFTMARLNIDNFREINSALGPEQGDVVIRQVAQLVLDVLPPGAAICRESGDQFMLLYRDGGDPAGVVNLHRSLMESVEERARAGGLPTRVTLSLGAASFPNDAESATQLIERAGQALAEAKRAGRNGSCAYGTAVQCNPLIRGDHLFRRLRTALDERRLETHFQPILRSDDWEVAAFEALVRWLEPDLGWVSPNDFIPLAQARGLITELGRQVAEVAMKQLASWRAHGYEVEVALNISKRQLVDLQFAGELLARARLHGVDPRWVVVEATEREELLRDADCRATFQALATAGFRLSLDDFGSGHSSFDMVAELPLQEVKIDMKLVALARSHRGRHVLRTILEMCRALGLESVAEGIEDEDLALEIRRLGATRLQGYHFSHPLPADEATAFLADRVRRRIPGLP